MAMSVLDPSQYPLVHPSVFEPHRIDANQININEQKYFNQYTEYENLRSFSKMQAFKLIQNSADFSINNTKITALQHYLISMKNQLSILSNQLQTFSNTFDPLLHMSAISRTFRRIYVINKIIDLFLLDKEFSQIDQKCNLSLVDVFKMIQIYNVFQEKTKEQFWNKIDVYHIIKEKFEASIHRFLTKIQSIISNKTIQNLTLLDVFIFVVMLPSSDLMNSLFRNSKARLADMMSYESQLKRLQSIIEHSIIERHLDSLDNMKNQIINELFGNLEEYVKNLDQSIDGFQFKQYEDFLTKICEFIPPGTDQFLPPNDLLRKNRLILQIRSIFITNLFEHFEDSNFCAEKSDNSNYLFKFFFIRFPKFLSVLSNEPFLGDDNQEIIKQSEFVSFYQNNFLYLCSNTKELISHIINNINNLIEIILNSHVTAFREVTFDIFDLTLTYLNILFTQKQKNAKKIDSIPNAKKGLTPDKYFNSDSEPRDFIRQIKTIIESLLSNTELKLNSKQLNSFKKQNKRFSVLMISV